MSRASRKQAIKWFKRLLKYGLFVYACYCVADFYIRKEQSAESAAIHQADEKACQNKLASMKQVPILGGAYVDKTLVPEFYVGMPEMVNKKACLANTLKGLVWWTGTGFRRYQDQSLKSIPQSWRLYELNAGLYTRKETSEPHERGYRHVNWPDELIVKLKNYPGLEIWLDAPPPHFKNRDSVRTFVLTGWPRRDGTPRLIKCDGLIRPASEEGLNGEKLARFSRTELENLDFDGLNFFCTVELHSFDFAGGHGRVGLDTSSLREVPEMLKFLGNYLSHSVITRK
ncbi:hypothetical protein HU765_17460 [Pseudomonas sp. SWRI81]|uniref:hypothetical protein n=1 Tax=Pseudomonas sp. SWRI81 TaxID=2745505 RepID=UPI001644BA8A|nr:hypothetical protein [Pseudomonas sp. SWRI81]MBC3271735.1 hypothetical protein [Pseudomonas sp. SWRI81]